MAAGFPQSEPERKQAKEGNQSLYDLNFEISHHLYCILFIRSGSLVSAHSPWEAITLRCEYQEGGIIESHLGSCLTQRQRSEVPKVIHTVFSGKA